MLLFALEIRLDPFRDEDGAVGLDGQVGVERLDLPRRCGRRG